MKIVLALLPVLLQVVAGESLFSVEPNPKYVVHDASTVTLECITSKSVTCAWKVTLPGVTEASGFLDKGASALPDIGYREQGSETDCTIIITNVSSRYNGEYICAPYIGGSAQVEGITSEVIVAQKPVAVEFAGEHAGQREMTVTADETVSVTCEARDSRPLAELHWYLGEQELFEGVEDSDEEDTETKLVTSRSTLTHAFKKEDDSSQLRCDAIHQGYDEQDIRDVVLDIIVHYKPYRAEGDDLGTLYGYTAEEEGRVVLNFTANPAPSALVWYIGETTQVGEGQTSQDGRFTAGDLLETGPEKHQYSAQLIIQPVKMEDQDLPFKLRLANVAGDALLLFRLGTGTAPPPPQTPEASAGMGGGAIAGIIIALAILLLIVALIAFARSRGKWCFAAKPAEAGAEADTESANDEKTDKPEKKGFKLSNLYSSLVSKKKAGDVEAPDTKGETDTLTAPTDGDAGEEPPKKKEGEIVYAELVLDKDGLKTEVRPSPEKTEYAVIVGTKTEEEGGKE